MSARIATVHDVMTRAQVARALGIHVDTVIRLERRALRRLAHLASLRELAPERVDRIRAVRAASHVHTAAGEHDDEQLEPVEAIAEQCAVRALAAIFDSNVGDDAACAAVWEIYERHSRGTRPDAQP